MNPDLEPWDPEVADLLGAARKEQLPPDSARARVERRLVLAATATEPVSKPKPASHWRVGRGVVAFAALAAGVVLGVVGHANLRPTGGPRGVRRGSGPTDPVTAPGTYVPPTGSTSPQMLGAFGDPGRQLLDQATAKLMNDDAEGALALLEEHARKHPKGPLTELREALAIEALAHMHRDADAKERSERFFTNYPQSLLGPAVRDAVRRIP